MSKELTFVSIDKRHRINQFSFEGSSEIDTFWGCSIPMDVVYKWVNSNGFVRWWKERWENVYNPTIHQPVQKGDRIYYEMTLLHIYELRQSMLSRLFLWDSDDTLYQKEHEPDYMEELYKTFLEPLNHCEAMIYGGKTVYVCFDY